MSTKIPPKDMQITKNYDYVNPQIVGCLVMDVMARALWTIHLKGAPWSTCLQVKLSSFYSLKLDLEACHVHSATNSHLKPCCHRKITQSADTNRATVYNQPHKQKLRKIRLFIHQRNSQENTQKERPNNGRIQILKAACP